MSEILKRSITGALYIIIIVSTAFLSHYLLLVFFTVVGLICLREFQTLLQFKNIMSYFSLVVLLYYFNFTETYLPVLIAYLAMTLVVKLFLLKDLYTLNDIPIFDGKKHLLTLFYIVPSIIFLTMIPVYKENYEYVLIGTFVLIWTNDSFAYLVGKNFGKHKLFERISPKKTIEGFIGGAVFTVAMSYLIFTYIDMLPWWAWIILALIVSVFGTLGDLVQSKFKRKADVKDSGKIMPGHGGIFDRMDSMLFSSTFVFIFILFVDYVS
ncbi:phosphatidate cytidylyltransferase CdsA [Psychroflexus torquis ATCC 700755]|uniref:Phosphatidate cytidylyltransferase n=1 Tax=Psychroflexus torquis (strain ATCC 700755 / CIP 106069 / ACAM 623) TaxID=313595 RepID=K4IBX7_PSYTT|nr:phosphatidate cytidylyltransferase [Psychroflexus torquis]AFU67413.1 phosphatidate cytidylyltransferase CdsA [Psychroflexus torquis ATCC 700755]